MPTPTDIGIDIVGLVGPLVDLAFGLAGVIPGQGVLVQATITIVGARVVNPRTDTVTETGGYSVTIPGLLYQRSEQDAGELAAIRESTLLLNASDLGAAGVPDNVRPRNNDKALIEGDTWTVFGIVPIPSNTVHMLRIRR